jgi:hypothetical protein
MDAYWMRAEESLCNISARLDRATKQGIDHAHGED